MNEIYPFSFSGFLVETENITSLQEIENECMNAL